MINLNVILHDIFYDTFVNFLWSYPLFYTAGKSYVMYIGVFNTYLLLFVSSDSSSHMYATS